MWLQLFHIHPAARHIDSKTRRKAAFHAQQKALHHWQVLVMLAVLCISVVSFAIIDMKFKISDQNGTGGAALGFALGVAGLTAIIYRMGLPYYFEALGITAKTKN
jgi:hypothetical protein